ncbi:hypothetical protein IFT48_04945 [Pseudomonas fluorescens]|uniref:hypothetical protein n=1 Tax=Pseudomonas TaxID=286 RepID=UPI000F032012|nr:MULTISPECIES: hypothetical protein [Pseudomonas]MBD8089322.1 hypothetical protein [Pseudomonas fluorescens]MBD8615252.1 hypothetical protein [Pseudomonas putida]MBD8682095.1 hypothetical protein [Pseudomonas sp. CFBP 13719]
MSIELSQQALETTPESAFRAKEQIKVLMALREAEYSEADISFVAAGAGNSRLAGTLGDWLSNPKNCHEGKFTLVARPSLSTEGLKKHPKFSEVVIRENLKISEFSEAILIAKEVVIVNIDGEVSFVRRKDSLDSAAKIVRALKRIGALEKAKGI